MRDVAFHASGLIGLSVAEDRTLRAFDLVTGKVLKTVEDAHDHFVTSLAVHPSQPLVVTGGVDKLVKVWDCR